MADAVDSKSTDSNIVGVQVPSRAVCLMLFLGGFLMNDYKAMYYHLAGQMSIAIEALEGLVAITERLKRAQEVAEDIFLNGNEKEEDKE